MGYYDDVKEAADTMNVIGHEGRLVVGTVRGKMVAALAE